MRSRLVLVGSGVAAVALVALPLALLWYSRRRSGGERDRMNEKQLVRKKKEPVTQTFLIKKDDVRFVIGRKGNVIRDIEQRNTVKISFPEDPYHETDQTVCVKGACKDDVLEAIEDIHNQLLLKPVLISEDLEVRSEFCGKIIGKGGDNLRGIRDKSGTRILISREPHNGDPDYRLCSIEGTREEIDHAKMLIDAEIMKELEIRKRRQQREEVASVQKKSITSFESYDLGESVGEELESPPDSGTATPTNEPGVTVEEDTVSILSSEFSNLPSQVSMESGGFQYDSSYEMMQPASEASVVAPQGPPPTTIDEDVEKVQLRTSTEPSPALESYSLPPLIPKYPSADMGSESSVETLTGGRLPSSMYSSHDSNLSSASTLVNQKLTADLKSVLGVLSSASPTNTCSVYSYSQGGFEGATRNLTVSSALCSNHVWVVDGGSGESAALASVLAGGNPVLDRPTDLQKGEVYLFRDGNGVCSIRVKVVDTVSSGEHNSQFPVVECSDIDTGNPMIVPTSRLFSLPTELTVIPALASSVCLAEEGPCQPVVVSEILGSSVTIQRVATMGANKESSFPRVKMYISDQIVYNNRSYLSSPQSPRTDSVSLPQGSTLVYVSAIHNAGHFYVQVCGKNISELDRLERAMNQFYGTLEDQMNYSWSPLPGQMCAVWHTAEQMWLRGQVKELDSSSDMLYVKYLDYGDTVHVPRSYTRKLKSEFKGLPYQAIECFLANTIPITTRQWTPEATAKFDALTRCGQWYPVRCVVVGEQQGKPCVELYDQPYSEQEYSVGESLCEMEYARSSKLEKPAVQTLSTPIPSFASGAAYLVSPVFDDVDDELEELFACDDDSDSADSDDFPVSRENVSNLLLSLSNQISPASANWTSDKRMRPQTCGQAKNNAFMEHRVSERQTQPSAQPPKPQASPGSTEGDSESDCFETPRGSSSPKSSASSYTSAAGGGSEFNSTGFRGTSTTTPYREPATPLHLSSAEDTDCGS